MKTKTYEKIFNLTKSQLSCYRILFRLEFTRLRRWLRGTGTTLLAALTSEGSQLPVTPAPRDLMPSPSLFQHSHYTWHIYTKIQVHIIKNKSTEFKASLVYTTSCRPIRATKWDTVFKKIKNVYLYIPASVNFKLCQREKLSMEYEWHNIFF